MSFELRDHTADVAVAARGSGPEEVFAGVADGLAAAMCDEIPEGENGDHEDSDRFSFAVEAGSREALLYDYLADLIYERDVRGVLPVDNEVAIRNPGRDATDTAENGGTEDDATGGESAAGGRTDDDSPAGSWHLDASARGVPLDAIDAREVKAVTYSEMVVEEVGEGWHAYVVFDV